MRFCLAVTGCWLFGIVGLYGANDPGPSRHVTSIVRVDPHSGRLVRAVITGQRQRVTPSSHMAAEGAALNVRQMVEEAAKIYDVDPLLLHSVIEVESNYNPYAISPKGAEGMMQLIPATARRFGVRNSFSPKQNIAGGARYLRYLLDLFKDDRLAIAAYNAGEDAVIRYGGVPPYPETQHYVRLVGKRYSVAKRGSGNVEDPEVSEPILPVPTIEQFVDDAGRIHIRTR
jgi:hypothetical protein